MKVFNYYDTITNTFKISELNINAVEGLQDALGDLSPLIHRHNSNDIDYSTEMSLTQRLDEMFNIYTGINTNLNSHINNNTIHITQGERDNWNEMMTESQGDLRYAFISHNQPWTTISDRPGDEYFHYHYNFDVLQGCTQPLTNALVTNYNNAYNLRHTHSNKTILDNTTESFTTTLKTNYDDANTKKHTHITNGDGTKCLSDNGTYRNVATVNGYPSNTLFVTGNVLDTGPIFFQTLAQAITSVPTNNVTPYDIYVQVNYQNLPAFSNKKINLFPDGRTINQTSGGTYTAVTLNIVNGSFDTPSGGIGDLIFLSSNINWTLKNLVGIDETSLIFQNSSVNLDVTQWCTMDLEFRKNDSGTANNYYCNYKCAEHYSRLEVNQASGLGAILKVNIDIGTMFQSGYFIINNGIVNINIKDRVGFNTLQNNYNISVIRNNGNPPAGIPNWVCNITENVPQRSYGIIWYIYSGIATKVIFNNCNYNVSCESSNGLDRPVIRIMATCSLRVSNCLINQYENAYNPIVKESTVPAQTIIVTNCFARRPLGTLITASVGTWTVNNNLTC